MDSSDRKCTCGDFMDVARVDIGMHLRCPTCSTERADTMSYELDKGEIPPDITPIRNLARKRLSDNETMEVIKVDSEATGRPLVADEVTSDIKVSGTVAGSPTPREASSDEHPILPEGTALGNFKVLMALGQGGMGVVYKAHDTSLDRYVAIKVLSPQLGRNANFIERFRREAMACGKLSHPNITHIYSISSLDESVHYFAMEFVDGENLAERVKREGPFPVEEALEIVGQTGEGLAAAAAAKIIHRDIKPSNLLLTPSGKVKITDFGLAKAKASMGHTLDLTSTGVVMGTPLYMSPEQGRGGTVDHRSDIYSLGCTLFFLIYGVPPFEADSPIALILKHINDPVSFPPDRKVLPGVKGLLLRMLEKDLGRRLRSYEELLEDLGRIQRGETLPEESPQRVIVLTKKSRRRPTDSHKKKSGLFSTSGLKATKLSVARTNIKLGRREKAVSLLMETIEDGDPALRAEAALLLLSLYEKEGDKPGIRRMAETVLLDPPGRAAAAYAAWKLACLDESAAVAKVKDALARYEEILNDPPPDLPREVIEAQVRRLRAQINDAERETGMTQIVLGGEGKK